MRAAKIRLAKNEGANVRRLVVLQWLLNGYTLENRRMSADELAAHQGVPPSVIRSDIHAVKKHLAAHVRTESRMRQSVQAIIQLAAESIIQDRGRALEHYERLCTFVTGKDGKPLHPRDKIDCDINYQIATFLKLAQTSTEQLTRLLAAITSRGGVDLTDPGSEVPNMLTLDTALRILEDKEPARLRLPSLTHRGAVIDVEKEGWRQPRNLSHSHQRAVVGLGGVLPLLPKSSSMSIENAPLPRGTFFVRTPLSYTHKMDVFRLICTTIRRTR